MRLQKLICTLLIPLLSIGFFAGAVSAEPACDEYTCQQMAMPEEHHGAKPMIPGEDCCCRDQKVFCELERCQPLETSAFWTVSGRLQSHPFLNSIDPASGLQTLPHPDKATYQRSPLEAKARSVPIYLLNLSLIC